MSSLMSITGTIFVKGIGTVLTGSSKQLSRSSTLLTLLPLLSILLMLSPSCCSPSSTNCASSASSRTASSRASSSCCNLRTFSGTSLGGTTMGITGFDASNLGSMYRQQVATTSENEIQPDLSISSTSKSLRTCSAESASFPLAVVSVVTARVNSSKESCWCCRSHTETASSAYLKCTHSTLTA
ncbi:hypothetical protein B484DRAFT_122202 [Ochromonadaceae sp. CCMP2298]|nr:hypothetical protein B484DRAFT_122202 [Ochromonadaceae sp. CCMP2298]